MLLLQYHEEELEGHIALSFADATHSRLSEELAKKIMA